MPDVVKSNTPLERNNAVPEKFQDVPLFEDSVQRCPAHLFTCSLATAIVKHEEEELRKFVQCYVAGILTNSIEIVKSDIPLTIDDAPASSSVINNLAGEVVTASTTSIARVQGRIKS